MGSTAGLAILQPGAVYAWSGPSLLVTDRHGACNQGERLSGFYFREARHLRTLELEVDGRAPWLCEIATAGPEEVHLNFIHPERRKFGGGGSGPSGDGLETDEHGIPLRALDLRLLYRVRPAALEVTLEVTNRSRQAVETEVAWRLGADFADLREAHGGERLQEAPVEAEARGSGVRFEYRHPDLPLSTEVTAFGENPWVAEPGRLSTRLRLTPGETARLGFVVEPRDAERPLSRDEGERRAEWRDFWAAHQARVEVPPNREAERVIANNVRDLASFPLLEGEKDEQLALQAGVPLYPALFGRDALTAGWQAAMLDRGAAVAAALARLGRMQTDRSDDWRDEQPGRIPYQVRLGPLSRLGIDPFSAYYADHASPLMFVVSLAHCYSWTGDRAEIEQHWDTVRRVLDWARESGDADGDGYLEYQTRSPKGVKNQGWKDSGNAIVDEEGEPVPAPLGTCEMQGYWFAAQQTAAAMAAAIGHFDEARHHWRAARELKERFNHDWWLDGDALPALAFGPDKRPIRVPASNAGHCLASGIVSDQHVSALVGRLFAPDLYSGWGVRTLSTGHPSYNPLSYHLGSVWAVENATLALGLKRFGFDIRTAEVAEGLFALARLYPGDRIPECVGGYSRWERPFPGAYPRANTPQTWNASAFPLLIHSLLGLQPVGALDLLVVDPALPSWLPEVIVHDLHLGGATATLRFWRDADGASHAEVVKKRGTFHLVRQPPPESLAASVTDRFTALLEGVLHS